MSIFSLFIHQLIRKVVPTFRVDGLYTEIYVVFYIMCVYVVAGHMWKRKMFNKYGIVAVLASLAVSACGGSSDSGGSSSGSGGSPATDAQILEPAQAASTSYGYIINIGSDTINSDATSGDIFRIQSSDEGSPLGSIANYGDKSTYKAMVYEQDGILVIGGYRTDGGGGIVGYGPDTIAPAYSGEVTFSGWYALHTSNGSDSSSFDMTADFANSTFTGENKDASFTIDGTISDANINGDVTYNEHTAKFSGGFYAVDKVAAGFGGPTMGGVFYGTKD